MIAYRPSNGTTGELFYSAWCAGCHREQGGRQCRIYGASLAYDIDAPGYPKQWVSDDDGSNPRCTAFQVPTRRAHPTIRDKRQRRLEL